MITKAEPADLPYVVELLYAYLNEALEGKGIVPHLASGRDFLVRLVTEPSMCLFVAWVSGQVVGLIGGGVVCPWYNGEAVVGQQHMWYVKLKHRNSPVGVKLLRAFERWCREKGVSVILMPLMLHASTGKVQGVLEKAGYRQSEVWYTKEVDDG